MSFTVVKHQLESVKEAFEADCYYHIGDTNIDKHYADQGGFTFFLPEDSEPVFWD